MCPPGHDELQQLRPPDQQQLAAGRTCCLRARLVPPLHFNRSLAFNGSIELMPGVGGGMSRDYLFWLDELVQLAAGATALGRHCCQLLLGG